MRRALAQVRPTVFEDIIALGALYRPGPMDNIPSFAARKWGREQPDYLHPLIEDILRPTYGVIIYQEQVMQIAQVLAGYSLGEADLLRRAMGKKIKAEMDAQRARFIEGAVARGVEAARAESIFNLVDKFAGYGFNKSHAAAYALVALHTAWLKAHHPAAFFAASMAYDISQTDKLSVFVDDMRRLNVGLLAPCINRSAADFTIEDSDAGLAVRYALGALKGVGEAAMAAVVAERDARGAFRSLDDFAARIDPRLLNRRQMEALAAAGAFDCLGIDRARAFAGAELLLAAAARQAEERTTGQGGLFGTDAAPEPLLLPEVPPWTIGERLARERDAFGFWFGGHPVDAHMAAWSGSGAIRSSEALGRRAPAGSRQHVRMAGLVEAVRWRVPQGKGPDRRYMIADLTDGSGSFTANCFEADVHTLLEQAQQDGEALLLDVELGWREGDDAPRLAIRGATALAAMARSARALLSIRLDKSAGGTIAAMLADRLQRGGRSAVEIELPLGHGGRARLVLGSDFLLPAGIDLELAEIAGVAAAEIRPLDQPMRLVA
jgi:DNA polymerase-3 subunit alpha